MACQAYGGTRKGRCWLLMLLLLLSTSISAVEIMLKTGEVYIGDLVSEDEKSVKVNWKNQLYVFPKGDIQSLDYNKKGAHIVYRYSDFLLKDGSRIRGVIAEEDKEKYTLKTEMGFLTLEKKKITSLEKSSAPLAPPDIYLLENKKNPETKIGISAMLYANDVPLKQGNPTSSGGGWFVEPAFFGFGRNWKFGYKGEYLAANGKVDYDFFNNFLYIQYNPVFSRRLDFYLNLGTGVSYVRYIRENIMISGIDPALYMEAGWQGLRFGNVFLRFGLRYMRIQEKSAGLGMGGGEISVGYVL